MATLATDDMNRGDAATLGNPPWVAPKGIGNELGIFSNQADTSAVAQCADCYDGGISWPNDQWAQAKIVTVGSLMTEIILRGETASGTQRNFYLGGTDNNDRGAQNTLIQKFVADTLTQLADSGAVDISAGNTIYFEVRVTTLKILVNGVQKLSTTDVSLTGGKPGLEAGHAVNTAMWDDFLAGDFSASGMPLHVRGIMPWPGGKAMRLPYRRQNTTPAATVFNQTFATDPDVAVWSIAAPSVLRGGLTLTPNANVATWSIAAPTVLKTRTLTPVAVVATWSVATPTVVRGAIAKTPSAVVAVWSIAAPTVIQPGGPQTITPAPVVAAWGVAAPTVVKGTRTLTPNPVVGTWSIVAPQITGGAQARLRELITTDFTRDTTTTERGS